MPAKVSQEQRVSLPRMMLLKRQAGYIEQDAALACDSEQDCIKTVIFYVTDFILFCNSILRSLFTILD